jgi:phosphatidylserine/phosphatidylglycerophosphate/cardiolipin synthase-like enzyme
MRAQALQAGFRSAQRRVVLASLYWGAEAPHERALLASLAAAAASRPDVRVTVLLDALRGTRPVPDGRGGVTSSAAALASTLLAAGARNARVALFHAPALRGPLARAARALPPRAREVAGVCHVKAAIFDDDALWTGANLAETYLTNRQARTDGTCSQMASC